MSSETESLKRLAIYGRVPVGDVTVPTQQGSCFECGGSHKIDRSGHVMGHADQYGSSCPGAGYKPQTSGIGLCSLCKLRVNINYLDNKILNHKMRKNNKIVPCPGSATDKYANC